MLSIKNAYFCKIFLTKASNINRWYDHAQKFRQIVLDGLLLNAYHYNSQIIHLNFNSHYIKFSIEEYRFVR